MKTKQKLTFEELRDCYLALKSYVTPEEKKYKSYQNLITKIKTMMGSEYESIGEVKK